MFYVRSATIIQGVIGGKMKKYTLLVEEDTIHDSDVVLLDDKKILCILENERVTKHKHAVYEKCDTIIDYVLKRYNIGKDEVNIVKGINTQHNSHHELHALATYLSSGYDKASILVIDGYGDQDDSVTLFAGRGQNIYELKKYHVMYSLGNLYNCASRLLYDNAGYSEGKMMGLSCCSEPEYSIPSPIQYHEDGTVECIAKIDENCPIEENIMNYIKEQFSYLIGNDGNVMGVDIYKAKIAATVQWWFTEQVVNLVKYIKKLNPNTENLCVCGGCFLNCETNGIIDRLKLFKNIYCIPAPADNSIVLGRAQQFLVEIGSKPQTIKSPYWGPDSDKTFEDLLEEFKIKEVDGKFSSQITNAHDISKYSEDWVIERLKEDRVILWFDGGSEFGPRALGHRSFLANPATNEMFWRLSVKIKNRENYRPLAPITTDELYPMIFEDPNPENLTQFMLKTVKVKDEWRSKLKAVTHINQTARPQRLTEDVNPVLYSLISKWYKESGLPCLINTSLNLKGQPLLETYDDLKSILINPNILLNKCSVVIDHKLCFDIYEGAA